MSDGYAYVTTGLGGLSQPAMRSVAHTLVVVDISEPSNPTVVGFAGQSEVESSPFSCVALGGNYAYVGSHASRPWYVLLRVVDVTAPSSPTIVGVLHGSGTYQEEAAGAAVNRYGMGYATDAGLRSGYPTHRPAIAIHDTILVLTQPGTSSFYWIDVSVPSGPSIVADSRSPPRDNEGLVADVSGLWPSGVVLQPTINGMLALIASEGRKVHPPGRLYGWFQQGGFDNDAATWPDASGHGWLGRFTRGGPSGYVEGGDLVDTGKETELIAATIWEKCYESCRQRAGLSLERCCGWVHDRVSEVCRLKHDTGSGCGEVATLAGSDQAAGVTKPVQVTSAGGHGATQAVTSLFGESSDTFSFGAILRARSTICSLTRYTTSTASVILASSDPVWWHGHADGQAGVAHMHGDITTRVGSVHPNTDWVLQCTRTGALARTLVNGFDRTNGHRAGQVNDGSQLLVNGIKASFGDFAIAEVMVWERELSDSEMWDAMSYLQARTLGDAGFAAFGLHRPMNSFNLSSHFAESVASASDASDTQAFQTQSSEVLDCQEQGRVVWSSGYTLATIHHGRVSPGSAPPEGTRTMSTWEQCWLSCNALSKRALLPCCGWLYSRHGKCQHMYDSVHHCEGSHAGVAQGDAFGLLSGSNYDDHPLDNQAKLLLNTMVDARHPVMTYISFAYPGPNTDRPPSSRVGRFRWLSAALEATELAMPTRFEKVDGARNVYVLRNIWQGDCPGGACSDGYDGYVCRSAKDEESRPALQFMHSSCTREEALPLRVTHVTNDEIILTTLSREHVSFCQVSWGECGGAHSRWLSASLTDELQAMTFRLVPASAYGSMKAATLVAPGQFTTARCASACLADADCLFYRVQAALLSSLARSCTLHTACSLQGSIGSCPASHPHAFGFNMARCCATRIEANDSEQAPAIQPAACDGSVFFDDGVQSTCCERDDFVPCPARRCANYGQTAGICPASHPYAFGVNLGQCCRSHRESIRSGSETGCDSACHASCCTCSGPSENDCLSCPGGAAIDDGDGDGDGTCSGLGGIAVPASCDGSNFFADGVHSMCCEGGVMDCSLPPCADFRSTWSSGGSLLIFARLPRPLPHSPVQSYFPSTGVLRAIHYLSWAGDAGYDYPQSDFGGLLGSMAGVCLDRAFREGAGDAQRAGWSEGGGDTGEISCDAVGACHSSCCTCDGPSDNDCLSCLGGAEVSDEDGDGAGACSGLPSDGNDRGSTPHSPGDMNMAGWHAGLLGESCHQACAAVGLVCTEAQLRLHNTEVDQCEEVAAIVARYRVPAGTCGAPQLGIPEFNTATNDVYHPAESGSQDIENFDCGLVRTGRANTRRLCFCHAPLPFPSPPAPEPPPPPPTAQAHMAAINASRGELVWLADGICEGFYYINGPDNPYAWPSASTAAMCHTMAVLTSGCAKSGSIISFSAGICLCASEPNGDCTGMHSDGNWKTYRFVPHTALAPSKRVGDPADPCDYIAFDDCRCQSALCFEPGELCAFNLFGSYVEGEPKLMACGYAAWVEAAAAADVAARAAQLVGTSHGNRFRVGLNGTTLDVPLLEALSSRRDWASVWDACSTQCAGEVCGATSRLRKASTAALLFALYEDTMGAEWVNSANWRHEPNLLTRGTMQNEEESSVIDEDLSSGFDSSNRDCLRGDGSVALFALGLHNEAFSGTLNQAASLCIRHKDICVGLLTSSSVGRCDQSSWRACSRLSVGGDGLGCFRLVSDTPSTPVFPAFLSGACQESPCFGATSSVDDFLRVMSSPKAVAGSYVLAFTSQNQTGAHYAAAHGHTATDVDALPQHGSWSADARQGDAFVFRAFCRAAHTPAPASIRISSNDGHHADGMTQSSASAVCVVDEWTELSVTHIVTQAMSAESDQTLKVGVSIANTWDGTMTMWDGFELRRVETGSVSHPDPLQAGEDGDPCGTCVAAECDPMQHGSWFGVTECNGCGEVIRLSLPDNSLKGDLSTLGGAFQEADPRFSLSSLVEIELSANGLTGTLPPELALISTLSTLHVESNSISGTIPHQLSTLTSVLAGELRLGANSLSGSVPEFIGRLDTLTTLSLYENRLSGSLPSALGRLSILADLELGDNRFSGSIPSEMAKLTLTLRTLSDFTLHGNANSGRLPQTMASAACKQKCATLAWDCCNDDYLVSENQYHSCLQGCIMVTAGENAGDFEATWLRCATCGAMKQGREPCWNVTTSASYIGYDDQYLGQLSTVGVCAQSPPSAPPAPSNGCLRRSSSPVVSAEDGVLLLDGVADPWSIGAGDYLIVGISSSHPIRFVDHASLPCTVSYTCTNQHSVGGYCWHSVHLQVGADCEGHSLSLECGNHGPMNGRDRLPYDAACAIGSGGGGHTGPSNECLCGAAKAFVPANTLTSKAPYSCGAAIADIVAATGAATCDEMLGLGDGHAVHIAAAATDCCSCDRSWFLTARRPGPGEGNSWNWMATQGGNDMSNALHINPRGDQQEIVINSFCYEGPSCPNGVGNWGIEDLLPIPMGDPMQFMVSVSSVGFSIYDASQSPPTLLIFRPHAIDWKHFTHVQPAGIGQPSYTLHCTPGQRPPTPPPSTPPPPPSKPPVTCPSSQACWAGAEFGLALGQSRVELSQCSAAYAVVPDAAVTWTQAKARCAARGAVLARLNGMTDLTRLTGHAVAPEVTRFIRCLHV